MTHAAGALLGRGLRAARERSLLVLGLHLAGLGWSLAFALPFALALGAATGDRPYAEPLARGIELEVLLELLARRPELGATLWLPPLVGLCAWLPLSLLLAGGTVGALRRAAPPTASAFGSDALGGFGRLLRVHLLLLPVGAAGLGIVALGGAAGWGISRLLHDEALRLWAVPVGAGLTGLACLAPGLCLLDAARVLALVEPDAPARRIVRRALRLAARPALLAARTGATLLGLLPLGLYLALATPFGYGGWAGLCLLTLLRQLVLGARTATGLAGLAACLAATEPMDDPG